MYEQFMIFKARVVNNTITKTRNRGEVMSRQGSGPAQINYYAASTRPPTSTVEHFQPYKT